MCVCCATLPARMRSLAVSDLWQVASIPEAPGRDIHAHAHTRGRRTFETGWEACGLGMVLSEIAAKSDVQGDATRGWQMHRFVYGCLASLAYPPAALGGERSHGRGTLGRASRHRCTAGAVHHQVPADFGILGPEPQPGQHTRRMSNPFVMGAVCRLRRSTALRRSPRSKVNTHTPCVYGH